MTSRAARHYKRAHERSPAPARTAPRGFAKIETWVFDLDNTLYPHHLNLWQQVDERIRAYIADFLKVSHDEAFRVQKDYYKRYGTSMRGMMTEHGMNPDEYLAFVHHIDHSPLEPNPALGAAIEQLPGRKLILTNGTRAHADAVMRRLEIHEKFEDVFDIIAAELEPKPLPQTYDRFLKAHGVDPARAAMFEDLSRNLDCAAFARHDHRAGGAGGLARGAARRLGNAGPRCRACGSRDRRSGRFSAEHCAALTSSQQASTNPKPSFPGTTPCQTLPKPSTTPSRSATRSSPSTTGAVREAVDEALDMLDRGDQRVAEKQNGKWQVNQWLKKAVLLSFRLNDMWPIAGGPGGANWWDKVPSKFEGWGENRFRAAGFRAVPGSIVRRSAYIAPNVVLMPSFVNLGAYVGEGTMVDTWATVGSCAQIGKHVHLSGGVGIGGVLEPLQANPVIIEDNCFIGARSEVVEGVIVREGSVLSMGVFISASTKIVDRETGEVFMGEVPAYSVVVPGACPASR